MSDAKIADTDSEIKKQIDAKYSLILDRLKSYDEYALAISRLEKSDDLVFSVVKGLEEKLSTEKDSLSSSVSKMGASVLEQQCSASALSCKIDSLAKLHDTMRFDLDSHKEFQSQSHRDLSNAADALAKKCIPKEAFLDHQKKFDYFFDEVRQHLSSISDDLISAKKSISSQNAFLLKLSSELDDLRGSQKGIKDEMQERSGQLTQKIEGYSQAHTKRADDLTHVMKSSISSLGNLHQASNSSFEAIRDQLGKRLESLALDATNAIARSMNVEQHTKILDKKIESILLQLKKFELTQ